MRERWAARRRVDCCIKFVISRELAAWMRDG